MQAFGEGPTIGSGWIVGKGLRPLAGALSCGQGSTCRHGSSSTGAQRGEYVCSGEAAGWMGRNRNLLNVKSCSYFSGPSSASQNPPLRGGSIPCPLGCPLLQGGTCLPVFSTGEDTRQHTGPWRRAAPKAQDGLMEFVRIPCFAGPASSRRIHPLPFGPPPSLRGHSLTGILNR